MVMFSYRIIIFLFSCLIANYSLPTKYTLSPNYLRSQSGTPGWPSKGYVDLRYGINGGFFAGTWNGLGEIDALPLNLSESSIEDNLYKIVDPNLPEGGNPVVKTYPLNNGEILIVVSGILTVPDPRGDCDAIDDDGNPFCQKGTGISWSIDSGSTWRYMDQPESVNEVLYPCEIDEEISCYDSIWNGQTYVHGVHRGVYNDDYRVSNVTFDVAVDIDYEYIYAASWYGLLKRFKYTDPNPQWESVPLPDDSSFILSCDNFPPEENYYYGAAKYDNNRPFSVEIIDGYIWVGASGINRGEILGESCINWTRYTNSSTFQNFPNHYGYTLSSDWVVGIYAQKLEEGNRIWTINWIESDPESPHSLSYTDDNGAMWKRDDYFSTDFSFPQARVYNLYSFDSTPNDGNDEEDMLYASTSKGLFKFVDHENWERQEIANDDIFSEIGVDDEGSSGFEVRAAIVDENSNFLVGTIDGLIVKDSYGDFYYPEYVDAVLTGDYEGMLIYPNPLSANGENHATFVVEGSGNGRLEIYDFSMSKVYDGVCDNKNQTLKCNWNGINNSGDSVVNGVYFCKLYANGKIYWEKLGVINRK